MQVNKVCILILLLLIPWIQGGEDEIEEDWDEIAADLDAAAAASTSSAAQARNLLVDLTDQSAQRVISSHQHVFLLGYASWCTRSSELMPEFAAAAAAFAGTVVFAKLDAVVNPKAAALYNVKGYPTLLFFTNASQMVYNGGDTREGITIWIRKKTGSPVSTVSSRQDAESLSRRVHVLVGGFFEKLEGHEYESFLEAAKQEVGTEFFQTTSLEVARGFNPGIEKPATVWVQKTEPENYVSFDDSFTAEELLKFVEINKYPLVLRLTSKNSGRINYSPHKIQVFLFAEEGDIETVLSTYQEVAAMFKGQMLFLVVHNADLDLAMPYLSLYGVQPGKPIVAAFNYESRQKYLLEKDLDQRNLMVFCNGLVDGTLTQHYKSQPVPLKKKGHLQIVVGKTFEDVVFDETKDVFLQLTSPWCATCEAANKTMEKLALAFKQVSSVVIAQIDASANEHPKLEVNTFPAFLFYPAGSKNKPITPPKTNLRGFIEFIKTYATVPFNMPNEPSSTKASDPKTTDDKDEL